MAAQSDIVLLSGCAQFTLAHTHEKEIEVLNQLETSSATSLVMALRIFRLQRAVLAIGMFSLFESLLQDMMPWTNPFADVKPYLEGHSKHDLARVFEDFKDAINVLKHGKGRSYDRLIERGVALEFKVKQPDESFFCEGDVGEVSTLIEVDDAFVRRCAEIIEAVAAVIRENEDIWI